MEQSSTSSSPRKWLVEAFSRVASDPDGVFRELLSRPQGDQSPAQTVATRAFVGVRWLGFGNRNVAEAVLEALENGFNVFRHYGNEVLAQYPEMIDRVIRALEDLEAASSPISDLDIVHNAVNRGEFDYAAKAFDGLVLSHQQAGPALNGLDGRLDEIQTSVQTWFESFSDRAGEMDALVATAREHLKQASSNVNLLADQVSDAAADAFASDYDTQASSDESTARTAIGATFVFLGLGLATAITFAVLGYTTDDKPSTADAITHATVTLSFFALAGYSGRLAGEFRRAMWHWKHTALQLRMFFPFIGRLEPADQLPIVSAMTSRFFPGQPAHPMGDSKAGQDADGAVSASDAVVMKLLDQALKSRRAPTANDSA